MKKQNLKIAKIKMLIGLVIFIIMAALLALSIVKYIDAKNIYAENTKKYETAYNEWRDEFMDGNASISTKPNRSDYVGNQPLPIFIIFSSVGCVMGIFVIIMGAAPYIFKLHLIETKETLSYVGEDISDVGKQAIDVASPVINKAVDDIIVPSTKKIGSAIGQSVGEAINTAKNGKQNTDSTSPRDNNIIYCKHCGTQIAIDSKYCSKCGKKQ